MAAGQRTRHRLVLRQSDGPNPPWLVAELCEAVRATHLPKLARGPAERRYEPAPALGDAEARALVRIDQIAAGNPERVAQQTRLPPEAQRSAAAAADRRLYDMLARLAARGYRVRGKPLP